VSLIHSSSDIFLISWTYSFKSGLHFAGFRNTSALLAAIRPKLPCECPAQNIFARCSLGSTQRSWGESAGAISVASQMITNGGNTEGLFRGGVMQSGSPIPVGDITNGQQYYDFLVQRTGCSGKSDTLACLRTVPYDTLKDAINATPAIFDYQVRSCRKSPTCAYIPCDTESQTCLASAYGWRFLHRHTTKSGVQGPGCENSVYKWLVSCICSLRTSSCTSPQATATMRAHFSPWDYLISRSCPILHLLLCLIPFSGRMLKFEPTFMITTSPRRHIPKWTSSLLTILAISQLGRLSTLV
jgi:hypothetical protein